MPEPNVPFIPGIELCGLFFREIVQPILAETYPDLRYDAALIGYGSEVLGFDTPMSRDHGWGTRLYLYLSEADNARLADSITDTLRVRLPTEFRGYTTHYELGDDGSMMAAQGVAGNINHLVRTSTVRQLALEYIQLDSLQPIRPADWLTIPEQKLRALTSGAVYHAELGDLPALRSTLHYYPRDVWLYLLACQWQRINQEEPFVGRTGDVGDELGSRIIAARLVRDLMRLGFLIERVYAPYPKWFGTAFSHLHCAPTLTPIFQRVLSAETWRERESHLTGAYEYFAKAHNALNITDPLPTQVSSFYTRPYQVIHSGNFVDAILAQITDEDIKRIAASTLIGGIDQLSDNTDLLENSSHRHRLTNLYSE